MAFVWVDLRLPPMEILRQSLVARIVQRFGTQVRYGVEQREPVSFEEPG